MWQRWCGWYSANKLEFWLFLVTLDIVSLVGYTWDHNIIGMIVSIAALCGCGIMTIVEAGFEAMKIADEYPKDTP